MLAAPPPAPCPFADPSPATKVDRFWFGFAVVIAVGVAGYDRAHASRASIRVMKALPVVFLCAALAACGPSTPRTGDAGTGGGGGDAGFDAGPPVALGVPPQCNPLRDDPLDCLTPWPSAAYEVPSATSASGFQVDLPASAMPQNANGVFVDPGRIDMNDGFSPAGPLVVHFAKGLSGGTLPGWENLATSIDPSSPTQLLAPDGSRVVHFAELDAKNAPPRQALYIRPMVRLQPKTRYVAVLLRGLLDSGGQPLVPSAGMAALLSGQPTDDARLEGLRPGFQASVLPVLQKAGIAPSSVLLAWDFVTSSDEDLTAHVRSMRDTALAAVGDGSQIAYTITSVDGGSDGGEGDGGSHLYARIVGTFDVPLFLTEDGGENGTLVFDDGGTPVRQGSYSVKFAALVPSAITTATPANPVPVLIFGHGLLGDAVEYSTDPVLQQAAEQNGMLMVMTNWTGLSAQDEGIVALAVDDMNSLPLVTDKTQQAIVNAATLVRFARGSLARDPLLEPNGEDVIDPKNAYYYGISLGGIMGDTFMAYDPDVLAGVLNVPGGCWSLMLQRSSHWAPLAAIFQTSYPDGVDQAVLSSYVQSQFDFADPITTAPYVLSGSPLTGVPPKRLLMQEGRYDMQVPNLATEMTARTLDIPLMTPTDDTPYGLVQAAAPLPSALTIYDLQPSVKPNSTNALNTEDNGVHDGVYPTAASQRQVTAFLQPDGRAIQPCSGAQGCVCAAPADACN